ncbi:MAG TPA: preprotein translocase subunit Sec61beta [Thermoplasmata archaeon]|nr:preprotein translocase subunit Sec61beta [Thermoplasmata archaeon]
MPEGRRSGFSSAAGLIQYYDMEETRSLKLNPYFVMSIGVVAAFLIEILNWRIG